MTKVTSAEDFKLSSSYESLRQKLLAEKYADRMDKPLAYWALPNDRRLPLALMGHTLGDLLNRPFEDLSATPGIGQKKISSLVKLLLRATKEEPPTVPFGIQEFGSEESDEPAEVDGFDHEMVSEAMWVRWQATVRRHGLADQKLGRLAPSLQALPTVIWHTPLGFYLDHSLEEIRALKTHGEKRVRVVLEVFHAAHEMLEAASSPRHLAIRLVPKFVLPIQQWIESKIESDIPPTADEVREQLTLPLLRQVKIDAGDVVLRLAEGRLGTRGKPQSVRVQSQKMGVTRARVYQLLDDCGKTIQVRWPDGRCLLSRLADRIDQAKVPADDRVMLDATRELFFPNKLEEEEE